MASWNDTDLDNAVNDDGTAHENVTSTPNTNASEIRHGYSYINYNSSFDPIAHYPLHSDTNDVRGSNDGTNNGVTFVTGGPIGQDAGDFGGSDSVICGDTFDFGTQSFSLSVWFRTGNAQGPEATGIVAKEMFDTGYGIGTRTDGDGLFARIDDDATPTQVEDTGFVYNDNSWHLATMTVNRGTETLELFIDGSSAGTADTSSTGSINNASNFTIGDTERSGGDDDRYFEGNIADVRIYDHALSTSEVSYLYQVSQSGQYRSDYKTL